MSVGTVAVRNAAALGAAVLGMAALAACSSGSSSSAAEGGAAMPAPSPASAAAPVVTEASPAPAGYWTKERLEAAQEWQAEPAPSESASASSSDSDEPKPDAKQNAKTLRVGAIFEHDSSGNHFCSASVVDSPAGNVIVTAAHCINGGRGGDDKSDIAFVPAYSDGNAPFGEWTPERYVMDPRWVKDHNEHYDVAFVVLKDYEGKNIQEVLGGNSADFNAGYRHYVEVTGYPSSYSAPITCSNWTSEADGYLEFQCGGYYGGTSGSPWVTDYNAQTRTGKVVGILGGYLEGGSVHNISFSSYLGDDIEKLYNDAAGK
jgi:V8-like Glu-specific endopeptidase